MALCNGHTNVQNKHPTVSDLNAGAAHVSNQTKRVFRAEEGVQVSNNGVRTMHG